MSVPVYECLVTSLLPERCPLCAGRSSAGFCDFCLAGLTLNRHACAICGVGPLAPGVRGCAWHPSGWAIDLVIAPWLYCGRTAQIIHRLKFGRQRSLGRALALALVPWAWWRRQAVDEIMAVPMHPRRWLERGFNQSGELARIIGGRLGLPVRESGLERVVAVRPQSTLGSDARRSNVKDSFLVSARLAGCRVAVVDDVLTTGATINEFSHCLKAAGASWVEAWVVARAATGAPPG